MEVFRVSHAVCDHGDVLDLSWSSHVISHVCRLWRYIAIEKCPEIWADFWLERNRWDFLKDPVALLSLALSRSGNSPLEFLVEGAGGNDCQLVVGCRMRQSYIGRPMSIGMMVSLKRFYKAWSNTVAVGRMFILTSHFVSSTCYVLFADDYKLPSPVHTTKPPTSIHRSFLLNPTFWTARLSSKP
ncbi:hypothetical protein ARMGADRAFT_619006 [Armillaria gallica]|uniref:F-box domain-containing protein n=1 Tax=Armillaria gallica TaxID=47427 RepID=A0A2H3CLX6_ARMGA|nr:hypothetical protein ARMGADRAFT_619006 [Armillaria gallica]